MASSDHRLTVPFAEVNDLSRRLTEASSDLSEHLLEQGLTRAALPEVDALILAMTSLVSRLRQANERDADE